MGMKTEISYNPFQLAVLSVAERGEPVVIATRLRNEKSEASLMRLSASNGAFGGVYTTTEFYDHVCPDLEAKAIRVLIVGDYELTDKAFAIEQSMMLNTNIREEVVVS
jgi:hypothetical protein